MPVEKYLYVTYESWKGSIHSYGDFAISCSLISIKELKVAAANQTDCDVDSSEMHINFILISKEEFDLYCEEYK